MIDLSINQYTCGEIEREFTNRFLANSECLECGMCLKVILVYSYTLRCEKAGILGFLWPSTPPSMPCQASDGEAEPWALKGL